MRSNGNVAVDETSPATLPDARLMLTCNSSTCKLHPSHVAHTYSWTCDAVRCVKCLICQHEVVLEYKRFKTMSEAIMASATASSMDSVGSSMTC